MRVTRRTIRTSLSRRIARRTGVRVVAPFALPLLLLASATPGHTSALLPMSNGAADMSLSGTNIAEPLTPAGALFSNPAGLCAFEGTTVTGSLGYGFGSTKINNEDGYFETNHLWAIFPDAAIAFAGSGRWHYGFGMYGGVGASYDFDADPSAGVDNDFHAETSVAEIPFALAYRVNDRLYLGAELIGLFGHLRNRYTRGGELFKYTLRGGGVQAMFGLTWKPDPRWSLGLGVRTPGRIWMDGSTVVPATVRRDVDLDLNMPTQVSLGVTHHLTDALTVSAAARWTDSSRFADSEIEFDGRPMDNVPFLPAANDEWRFGLAAEFEPIEDWKLRLGVSHSNRIVGTAGISPLVYDNEDNRVSIGLGVTLGTWTLDAMAGYSFHEGRDVDSGNAAVIPGHFDSGGGIGMLGMTRRL